MDWTWSLNDVKVVGPKIFQGRFSSEFIEAGITIPRSPVLEMISMFVQGITTVIFTLCITRQKATSSCIERKNFGHLGLNNPKDKIPWEP